jgi:GH15 family glucan-1,4-alpha-glucosidase
VCGELREHGADQCAGEHVGGVLHAGVDGLPGGEGQFLACSFWLVSALALNGRVDEARALFARLIGLSNDLGLLAEEYDVERGRQVGNFPQAFSHLTLIGAAYAIDAAEAPASNGRRKEKVTT